MIGGTIGGVLLFALALAAAVLVLIFVLVPLLKGVGWVIGGVFRLIGWLVAHVFEFIGGMLGDALRFVGSIIAFVLFAPLVLLNVVIGRWSAAGHFAESAKRECKVGAACLYRVVLRRPLKLLLLHGLLEGVEQRVPEAMAAAPTSDKPRKRAGQFPGYTIVGSLRGGGSGAKLYIAQPDPDVMAKKAGMPERVVIKSFALSEGSTIPQIVRESRALECAKQLGLVFDHGMDQHRFHYVMPYHAGDHLGIVTRQLHGETDGRGLERKQLETALGYVGDLVQTLSTYHRGGLWHKDVKPENIIVHSGRAHLVDLGLVTPLRSAMTLTTHGTEYFRDPEMVRQALRGAKVHQIDGAKFDVYAAGAVLYFVMENTFPPHGALSRFSRKSPDAIRWIIRRAMADYNHRYESSDAMLADLAYVARAGDCFSVKPAELPSMRGADAEPLEFEEDAFSTPRAGSPVPPPRPSSPSSPPHMPGRRDPAPAGDRPELEVVNWWTGAYRVTDSAAADRAAQEAATEWRHQTADLRHKVRTGAVSARTAARAQIKAARTRAKEIRERAKKHRRLAVAERQPSGFLAAIVVLVMVIGGFFAVQLIRKGQRSGAYTAGTAEVYADAHGDTYQAAENVVIDRGRPVLLVPLVDDPTETRMAKRLEKIAEEHREKGYDVIVSERILEEGAEDLLRDWLRDKNKDTDTALEDLLEQYGFYGILHVSESNDKRRVRGSVIWSERKGAEDRRFPVAEAPMASLPYLLINDHPTKHDPEVAAAVDRSILRYQVRGWPVVVNEEAEAFVRAEMPAGPIGVDTRIPDRLHVMMAENGLGGIVYVFRGEGDRQIAVRRIDARDILDPTSTSETSRDVDPATPDGLDREGPDARATFVVPFAPAACVPIMSEAG